MKFNTCLAFSIFLSICINQTFIENSANFLNPLNNVENDNLTYNQSFGFSVSSLNGIAASNAIFSNNFNYKLTNKMNLKSNIHVISSNIKNYDNTNNLDIQYDFLLDYKISENIEFKMKISNSNYYNHINSSSYFNLLND